MIRLGVSQLRQPPMAETQRQVLCHCLRVGVVFLLRPLRSTTTKGVSAQVRERRVEQPKRSALLSVVSVQSIGGHGKPWPRRRSQACASCDSTAGASGAYHLKCVESPSQAGPTGSRSLSAHCLGSSPPHHTWVLRHIGNGVISSRSVGLLDVRFTISTRSR
jgi:hypothetical protein